MELCPIMARVFERPTDLTATSAPHAADKVKTAYKPSIDRFKLRVPRPTEGGAEIATGHQGLEVG